MENLNVVWSKSVMQAFVRDRGRSQGRVLGKGMLGLMVREEGFPGQQKGLCRVWHRREPSIFWLVIAGWSMMCPRVCFPGLTEVMVAKEEDGSQ